MTHEQLMWLGLTLLAGPVVLAWFVVALQWFNQRRLEKNNYVVTVVVTGNRDDLKKQVERLVRLYWLAEDPENRG